MSFEPNQSTAERRKPGRQKSFLRGTVYFNDRRSAFDCLIRDLSSRGARLVFSTAVTIPDVLELHIPQKDRTLRANIVWRHSQEVGVIFAQNAELQSPMDMAELASRVVRLEAEVAALRRAMKKMQFGANHEFEPD
jgi:hypothetical protein